MNRSASLARVIDAQADPIRHSPDAATFIASVTELAAWTAARAVAEHTQATPAPAVGHPGIEVRVPLASAEPARPHRSRRLFTRAELIGYCGISAGATAAAGGIASAVTGSFAPLGVAALGGLLTSFGAAIASCRDDDRRILRATSHLTGGEQR